MTTIRQPTIKFVLPRLAEPIPCVAMTLAEAARAVGISASTLNQFINAGTLRAKRTSAGGRILITEDALRRWFDQLPDA